MSAVVNKCILDLVPDTPKDILTRLTQTTTAIYQNSLTKAPLLAREEIARYHICAFLAIERFNDKYPDQSIAEPQISKIPIEPRQSRKLVAYFQTKMFSGNETAPGTPTKNPFVQSSATAHDLNVFRSPSALKDMLTTPSPRKKRSLIRDVLDSPNKRSPTKSTSTSPKKGSPQKSAMSAKKDLLNDLLEPESASTSPTKSPGRSRFKFITAGEVINICNIFEVPSQHAHDLLATFRVHAPYFRSEWLFLCGILLQVVFTINHKILTQELKNEVIHKAWSLQKGGLTLEEVKTSMELVEEMIVGDKWYRLLKIEYNYEDTAKQYKNMGSMIIPLEYSMDWISQVDMDLELRG